MISRAAISDSPVQLTLYEVMFMATDKQKDTSDNYPLRYALRKPSKATMVLDNAGAGLPILVACSVWFSRCISWLVLWALTQYQLHTFQVVTVVLSCSQPHSLTYSIL